MYKMYSLLLVVVVLFSCGQSHTEGTAIRKSLCDSLTPFDVILYQGDEAIEKSEINVYQKDNKLYADNVFSGHFSDGHLTVWTTELDEDKITTCIKFVEKAKTLPGECPNNSTSVTQYIISFPKDTIRIRGNCQWDTLDFYKLRDILFRKNYAEEAQKKTDRIHDLSKKLMGRWYFTSLKSEPKQDDPFILTRANDNNQACFWEFGNDSSFKSSSTDKYMNLSYSKKYQWNIDGETYLKIEAGYTKNKDGNLTIENYDATFKLDTIIDDQQVRLKFLWR